jgi:phospholipid-binding lipoprotein MlaA
MISKPFKTSWVDFGSTGFRKTVLTAVVVLCSACSTLPANPAGSLQGLTTVNPTDPWERWNRRVYGVNETLDNAVLKPVAKGYAKVVPQPVRTGVSNFFGNFADGWSAVNNFLQFKFKNGFSDVARFGANSVFGILGIFDVATDMGLEAHREDLGQTLGYWGVPAGPYLVLPVLGPSNLRDSSAVPFDRLATSPASFIGSAGPQAGLTSLQVVDIRANLLGATQALDGIALDKYAFVRDAYQQRRRSLVYDGNPPDEEQPASEDASDTAAAPEAPAKKASAP